MARVAQRLLVSLLLTLGAMPAANAADFPSKPVRLIVTFSPGGTLDVLARLFAARLRDTWSQPVVVENRIGANGAIGVEHVARSAPDGHTLLLNATLILITQQLQKTPYDVLRDLTGVIQTTVYLNALGAHPKVGVSTIGELIELAKKQPGRLNYGSGGNGSSLHLYMELLKSAARIDITHVPYKGSAPALQALLAGEVDLVFDTTQSMIPLAKSGKVRPLLVTGTKTLDALPGVPPMDKVFPGLNIDGWHGIFVPAGTPKPIVERIAADIRAAVLSPALSARLQEMGFEVTGLDPERFGAVVRSDYERWGKLIRENKIRAD
ncbi:MAG: tripartite tricarboxylate transporter substrate binding protein [Betaproteobacteria bacterium]|nr:tripartite tricarboxylate transporter substrate binding protein [Betaproteobacteria bacterium]